MTRRAQPSKKGLRSPFSCFHEVGAPHLVKTPETLTIAFHASLIPQKFKKSCSFLRRVCV